MSDRSVLLDYNQQGKLETIRKIIGDKELIFRFDGYKAVLVGKNRYFKDRLYSSDDLWVPRRQLIAACRQATAIFFERLKSQNNNVKPSQPQLTFSFRS